MGAFSGLVDIPMAVNPDAVSFILGGESSPRELDRTNPEKSIWMVLLRQRAS
jgi:hypothetical protein